MSRLSDILQKIDQLQSEIDSHGELNTELQKRIIYKFRLDWNYFSNAMEGNSLTRVETKQLMMDNVTIDGKSFKDISEMRGHDEQVQEIFSLGKGDSRISERRIKEMHKAIMHEDDPAKKEFIGHWKTINNKLTNFRGENFEFLDHSEVPDAMHDLINKTNAEIDALSNPKKEGKHPVQIASEFHLEYVRIHPFYDGNGRTARLLTNLLLISCGYPPFLLSEDSRDSYNRILAEIQGYGGDPSDFHVLIGTLLIESQELVKDAIEGKDISEDDDVDKEVLLFKQSLSSEEVELAEKSDAVICKTYTDSLRPLFELFIKKHNQFEDMFSNVSTENVIDSSFRHCPKLEFFDAWKESVELDNDAELAEILGPNEESEALDKIRFVRSMKLRLDFRGFNKNGTNVFNDYSEIQVLFDQYKYSVVLGDDQKEDIYEKFYTQSLSEKEKMDIVNTRVKAFLEKLKSRVMNLSNE
ncbi:MAG: Fic family protein [Crocinitomicaceae bacterium]